MYFSPPHSRRPTLAAARAVDKKKSAKAAEHAMEIARRRALAGVRIHSVLSGVIGRSLDDDCIMDQMMGRGDELSGFVEEYPDSNEGGVTSDHGVASGLNSSSGDLGWRRQHNDLVMVDVAPVSCTESRRTEIDHRGKAYSARHRFLSGVAASRSISPATSGAQWTSLAPLRPIVASSGGAQALLWQPQRADVSQMDSPLPSELAVQSGPWDVAVTPVAPQRQSRSWPQLLRRRAVIFVDMYGVRMPAVIDRMVDRNRRARVQLWPSLATGPLGSTYAIVDMHSVFVRVDAALARTMPGVMSQAAVRPSLSTSTGAPSPDMVDIALSLIMSGRVQVPPTMLARAVGLAGLDAGAGIASTAAPPIHHEAACLAMAGTRRLSADMWRGDGAVPHPGLRTALATLPTSAAQTVAAAAAEAAADMQPQPGPYWPVGAGFATLAAHSAVAAAADAAVQTVTSGPAAIQAPLKQVQARSIRGSMSASLKESVAESMAKELDLADSRLRQWPGPHPKQMQCIAAGLLTDSPATENAEGGGTKDSASRQGQAPTTQEPWIGDATRLQAGAEIASRALSATALVTQLASVSVGTARLAVGYQLKGVKRGGSSPVDAEMAAHALFSALVHGTATQSVSVPRQNSKGRSNASTRQGQAHSRGQAPPADGRSRSKDRPVHGAARHARKLRSSARKPALGSIPGVAIGPTQEFMRLLRRIADGEVATGASGSAASTGSGNPYGRVPFPCPASPGAADSSGAA